jgi:hypothetical protein
MLFIAELPAISSRKLRPLCAIALALESTRTVVKMIVETFIANFSLWSVDDSNHTDRSGSATGNQIVRIDGGTMILPSRHSVN